MISAVHLHEIDREGRVVPYAMGATVDGAPPPGRSVPRTRKGETGETENSQARSQATTTKLPHVVLFLPHRG
jgi:hypothetical protein